MTRINFMNRLSVKYFVKNPEAVDLDAFIPLFHHWIQNHSVEGKLIDVADYQHVFQGPGVMLIGHEADYALNMEEGRPGLLYVRKRQNPDEVADVLRIAFHNALAACQVLESEKSLKPKLTFATNEAELIFLDRLHAPNTPETFEGLRAAIQTVMDELYKDAGAKIELVKNDPRACLTVRITVPQEIPLAELVDRLEAARANTAI